MGSFVVSPQRVTLAWMLAKSEHVIPIPGASRPESITDSAQAPELALTDEDGEVVSTEGSWEAGVDGAQPGIVMLAAARACENHVYVVSSTYTDAKSGWMFSGVVDHAGAVIAITEALRRFNVEQVGLPTHGVGEMLFAQGTLKPSGNALDLAIDGRGFVELAGPGGETLYWRGGRLRVTSGCTRRTRSPSLR